MKRFKAGRQYLVNGGGIVYVMRRTARYVVVCGHLHDGFGVYCRKRIRKDFGTSETILVPTQYHGVNYLCFADEEV